MGSPQSSVRNDLLQIQIAPAVENPSVLRGNPAPPAACTFARGSEANDTKRIVALLPRGRHPRVEKATGPAIIPLVHAVNGSRPFPREGRFLA